MLTMKILSLIKVPSQGKIGITLVKETEIMNFFKVWEQAQRAWLEGCIEFYGQMLKGAETLLDAGKQHHEAIKKQTQDKPESDGE